ncbi:MAG: cadmium-translocating P-type ATPase [Phycisphaerae bacterium]|jgi:Cd2+/Zn2+-exporting ATPase
MPQSAEQTAPAPKQLNPFSVLTRGIDPSAGYAPRFWCAGLCAGFGLVAYGVEFANSTAAAVPLIVAAFVVGGARTTVQGAAALRELRPDINFLMILAAVVSAVLGHWDEGALLLFLFSLSDALERYAIERTRRGVRALMDLRPETARVVHGDQEVVTPIERIRVGERVRIRPGERIPIDGVVLEGTSAADEAIVTGESMPVDKQPGDGVFAGTFNTNGSLLVRMSRPPTESTIARIVQLVEEAQERKANAQRMIEAWESPYVWTVLGVCALTILVKWLATGETGAAIYTGMVLLVAASPCAVVLASPVAVLATVTHAARHGVLYKGGAHIEALSRVTTVAFDKTGTLTRGKPAVTAVIAGDGASEDDVLRVAAAAESHSEHPLAKAIVARAAQRRLALPAAAEFAREPGVGISARVGSRWVRAGRLALFEKYGVAVPASLLARLRDVGDQTAIVVLEEEGAAGIVVLSDELRPEARPALAALRRLGIERFVVLTGDHPGPAAAVARELGIREVHADLLPEQKVAELHRLAKENGGVLMVGDGVNDAPALAAATVGIAMGAAGSDVALETADVVLMPDDLNGLPKAIHLARRCRAIIHQSLAFAFGMMAVLVTLTLLGLPAFGMSLPLPLAVLGHEGSTVLVVLNGLRLLRGAVVPQVRVAPDRAAESVLA